MERLVVVFNVEVPLKDRRELLASIGNVFMPTDEVADAYSIEVPEGCRVRFVANQYTKLEYEKSPAVLYVRFAFSAGRAA